MYVYAFAHVTACVLFNKRYMLIVEHKENIEKINKHTKIILLHLVTYILSNLFSIYF